MLSGPCPATESDAVRRTAYSPPAALTRPAPVLPAGNLARDHIPMTYITTQDSTHIFYKDWGPKDAQAIVFHHGWPLSADDWDNQMLFFLGQGFRVIAHDRRGHGRSSQPSEGNEMDTYASDVAELVARSEEHTSELQSLMRNSYAVFFL